MSAEQRLRAGGIVDPQTTIAEAARAGLRLPLACALLDKESSGGHNVFGHDPSIFAGAGKVTRERYAEYKRARDAGAVRRMQGVGPCQLTWWELQDQADREGGCWRPEINMRVGFRHLAGLIKSYGEASGTRRYNGSGAAAAAYSRDLIARARVWEKRLAGGERKPRRRPREEETSVKATLDALAAEVERLDAARDRAWAELEERGEALRRAAAADERPARRFVARPRTGATVTRIAPLPPPPPEGPNGSAPAEDDSPEPEGPPRPTREAPHRARPKAHHRPRPTDPPPPAGDGDRPRPAEPPPAARDDDPPRPPAGDDDPPRPAVTDDELMARLKRLDEAEDHARHVLVRRYKAAERTLGRKRAPEVVATRAGDRGHLVRASKVALARYLAVKGSAEHAALRRGLRREARMRRRGALATPRWVRAVKAVQHLSGRPVTGALDGELHKLLQPHWPRDSTVRRIVRTTPAWRTIPGQLTPNFNLRELGCKDGTAYVTGLVREQGLTKTQAKQRARGLAKRLERVRKAGGDRPLIVTSAFRTKTYNASLAGAATNSAHTRGYAADVPPPPGITLDTHRRHMRAAFESGVGYYPAGRGYFVHGDYDPTLGRRNW